MPDASANPYAYHPRLVRARDPHSHWGYVWIPIATAFLWFALLCAMLITWLAQGRPHYTSMSPGQFVAYISDVGADVLKPLFVVACVVTGIGFFASLVAERWLRHEGRLMANMRRREKVMSTLAILGSFLGGLALILLSILDTKRFPRVHDILLLVFMIGIALSALFTIIEFRWINKHFPRYQILRRGYILKGIVAGVLIVLAIAFAASLGRNWNVAGILEWIIGFGFSFYLLTFWYDLRASKGVQPGELGRERMMAQQERHAVI